MKEWKTFFAVLMTGALVAAGPAWAQTSGSTSPSPSSSSGTTSNSGTTSGTTGGSSTSSGSTASETGTPSRAHHRMGRMGRMNQEQVKAIQQALKDKGHDPGTVDGRMGPKTHAALKDFQKAEGLKVTGRPDSETMSKLGVETKTGSSGSMSPSASPSTSTGAPSTSSGAPSTSSGAGSSGSSSPSATSPSGSTGGGSMGGGSSTSGGSTGGSSSSTK